MTKLVGCPRVNVVSIYGKMLRDGETISRGQSVGRPRLIKDRAGRRLARCAKQDRLRCVADMTAGSNA